MNMSTESINTIIQSSTQSTIVLYHANCADGFGAAFAAWKSLGDTSLYIPIAYGQDIELSLLEDKSVYILDFSFPKDKMMQLFNTCERVVWLDHHKSAFDAFGLDINTYANEYTLNIQDYDCNPSVRLDNNRSGAMIAWHYFHDTPVPKVIAMIDDYDRWQFKLKGTKEFNKALWSYAPFNFQFFESLLVPYKVTDLIEEGAAMLKAHKQNVQSVVDHSAMRCRITWHAISKELDPNKDNNVSMDTVSRTSAVTAYGLAANCPKHLASDVGHELAKKSRTYGMCWLVKTNGDVEVSLRSNGDYDVTVLAKRFGGGGHKNAAGFTCSLPALLSLLQPGVPNDE